MDTGTERVIEARLAAIVATTGQDLSEEQLSQIRTRIDASLKQAAALRDVPLTNGDEPEIIFAPYRGEA